MNYLEEYKKWMNSSFIDEDTKNELKSIENNEKEIEELYSFVAPKDCNAKKNKISEDEKDDELEFI